MTQLIDSQIPLVDLKAQYRSIKAEIDAAIQTVLEESAFIGGRHVEEFEKAFARFVGVDYAVGVANGTDSLEIALQVMGIGPGDEVIVPANTWISTSESVTSVGAKPVFVDTHPDWYTLHPDKIAAKINRKTRAIIPVHLYGLPAEMDPIMALARKHGLKVLEDCAQAHGARYKGRNVGTFGDMASFSFYPGKNLGAYGDAGAIVTNNEMYARKARMIGDHGRVDKYRHEFEARNSRLDGLQAAILNVKLPHLEEWTQRRRRNAELYAKHLDSDQLILPKEPDYSRHVYHVYAVQVADRDSLQQQLAHKGIFAGIHYPMPLPMQKAYAYLKPRRKDFDTAYHQASRVLSLPMYPELDEALIERVSRTVLEILKP